MSRVVGQSLLIPLGNIDLSFPLTNDQIVHLTNVLTNDQIVHLTNVKARQTNKFCPVFFSFFEFGSITKHSILLAIFFSQWPNKTSSKSGHTLARM